MIHRVQALRRELGAARPVATEFNSFYLGVQKFREHRDYMLDYERREVIWKFSLFMSRVLPVVTEFLLDTDMMKLNPEADGAMCVERYVPTVQRALLEYIQPLVEWIKAIPASFRQASKTESPDKSIFDILTKMFSGSVRGSFEEMRRCYNAFIKAWDEARHPWPIILTMGRYRLPHGTPMIWDDWLFEWEREAIVHVLR